MPTAGSNFSRYPIPSDLSPDGICCISVPVPNDRQWIAMFMGALWRLSLQTHWERDQAHSAQVVAAKWREIWMEVQSMGGCCGPAINDIIITTQINVQMASYLFEFNQLYIAAGFDIDVTFPGTPDLFDSDPGDAGEEIARRSRALCLAVESLVNETFNRGLAFMQSQTEEVAGLIAIGVAIPFIPIYAVIGFFVGVGVLAGTVALQLANNDYRAYIACAILDALQGEDTNLKTAFYEAADNLPARPPPPENAVEDAARDLIEAWLRAQLNNVENYLGFIQSLNIAMAMAAAATDDDCGCGAAWSHTWLMGQGNQGDIAVDVFCNISGSYAPGPDRWESLVTVPPGCLNSGAISVKLTIPPGTNITAAKMRFAQHNEQVFSRWVKITSIDDWLEPVHVVHAEVLLAGVETDRLLETTVAPGAVTELFFTVMNRQTSPTAGRSKVLQITLEGSGVDPF